jgi:Flp pilus assembly protein TadD
MLVLIASIPFLKGWQSSAVSKRGSQATSDAAVREGFAPHQASNLKSAERHYRRALKRDKNNADALYLLGSLQVQAGQLKQAETALRKALAVQPNRPEALYNLARVLMDTDRPDQAEPPLVETLVAYPKQPSFLHNLGVVRLTIGNSAGAADALENAVVADPSSVEAWCDLGLAHSQCDDHAAAAEAFDRAFSLVPDHSRSSHNRGHLRLRQLEFSGGWPDYEARRSDPKAGFAPRPFDMPWWSGDEISGQTILVWGEQGLGDEILHAGMVPVLITKADHVVLECEPRRHSLFTRFSHPPRSSPHPFRPARPLPRPIRCSKRPVVVSDNGSAQIKTRFFYAQSV